MVRLAPPRRLPLGMLSSSASILLVVRIRLPWALAARWQFLSEEGSRTFRRDLDPCFVRRLPHAMIWHEACAASLGTDSPHGTANRVRGACLPSLKEVLPRRCQVDRAHRVLHVDTTLIRLLDGSRAYLQAVIDNFSRRILAWKVTPTFEAGATAEILLVAAKGVDHGTPTLLADGGVENFNGAVEELIDSGLLKRVLARTEITFSNSMIESWWRVLKHQWLFLNTLDTVRAVEKLVAFYVQEHNSCLPHSAFRGQTPEEMYFKTGDNVPEELEAARQAARQARAEANRKQDCDACGLPPASLN